MHTTQIAVRLGDDLLTDIDRLVQAGTATSRADAVRRGLELLITEIRRQETDEAMVGGYLGHPSSPDEDAAALEALRISISEEPW